MSKTIQMPKPDANAGMRAKAAQKEREAAQQRMAFFGQKREAFMVNVLCAMIHNPATDVNKVEDNTKLAIKYADSMMEKLYFSPVPEEAKEEKDK